MENFIFDLYGTLADIRTDENNPRFKRRVERYFAAHGAENFWERYSELCGKAAGGLYEEINLYEVFRQILGGADSKTVLKAAEYFRAQSRSYLKVYRGVHALLSKLKGSGAKLYLMTNAQSCFTLREIKKLRLTRYFDGILISSDFGKKKPAPEFFAELLKRYNINPAETCYVGNDIGADIKGAIAAGLNTAYIKSNISPDGDSVEEAARSACFATDSFNQLSAYLIKSRA